MRQFIEINETVEVEPHKSGYRQWKQTGRSLRLEILAGGELDCKVTSGHVTLDAAARRALADWLRYIPDGAVEAINIRQQE